MMCLGAIEFAESLTLTIDLIPEDDNKITCTLRKFGTSGWEKQFEFDRALAAGVGLWWKRRSIKKQ
jgi:hypothetical protein